MSGRLSDMLKLMLLKDLLENLVDEEDSDLKNQVEGIRVVRGPDWKWGDQDKGEGQVGTVRILKDKQGIVQVVWDHGGLNEYRASRTQHDLRIFDTAAVGVQHEHVTCDECHQMGIWGIRWKCQQCRNFDLCTRCYMRDKHMAHSFYRIDKPGGTKVAMQSRKGLRKVKATGIFAGAKVVRGKDWKWDNQDGGAGTKGVVLKIDDWSTETERNSAIVLWPNLKVCGYRLGYRGVVDLASASPNVSVVWGEYYPSHLPVLDIPRDYLGGTDTAKITEVEEASGNYATKETRPAAATATPTTAAAATKQAETPPAEASMRHLEAEVAEGKGLVGARVIRGKDWEWGNQDNGPLNMGTVEAVSRTTPGVVHVIWDHGVRKDYRSGKMGKFDLKVVDNAPAGITHDGIHCNVCGENPMRGIRWKCSVCDMVDLCTVCYGNNKHDVNHPFWRILTPKTERVLLVSRAKTSSRTQLHGIFKGATVVRGADWKWGSQDGGEGKRGTVIGRHEDRADSKLGHGWWKVKWQNLGDTSLHDYRVGLGGFVDLKVVTSASSDFFVYSDHLPSMATIETTSSCLIPRNFSKLEQIGKGSFGEVWHCYDPSSGTDFAMKRADLSGTGTHADIQEAIETFRREIRLYSKLPQCSRVCKYLGSQATDTSIDIYLEYIPGGSLLKQVPMDEEMARKFTKQTLEGLDFLHRNNIIHRDVKCSNILRDASGCAKLTDFGTKTLAGSLHWMAPEVLMEEGHDPKADIWSMACTVVEMITKYPPNFDAGNMGQVVVRITKRQLTYTLPASISAECREFLKSLFKFEPADRPSAAKALDHAYMRDKI